MVRSISDHLDKISISDKLQFKNNHNKDIYQRNCKHFDQQVFLEDIQNMNWNNVLEHNKKDVYNSFNKFF